MKYPAAVILVIMFGMTGCSSQKKLQADAPFNIEQPSCTPFSGGREASGSGFVLRLPISGISDSGISFEKVYFRGHILTPELLSQEDRDFLYCRYEHIRREKPDIIMHADPVEEVGNQPPALKVGKEEFPFELEPQEAVIAYRQKGKTRYAKISGIKDKAPELLPTRPEN